MNVSAFRPLEPQSTFPFPVPASDGPAQIKLIQDRTSQWFLMVYRAIPNDQEDGADHIDVYPVTFEPVFSISPCISHTHIFFKAGDTGFASTGTHYVNKAGRLLISSSYRYAEDEGPGDSSYVSRVDEIASA